MVKKKIVIIGGGFAGVSALGVLARHRKTLGEGFEVVLIDKKNDCEFLPALPDIIGKRVSGEHLRVDLKNLCERAGAGFIKGEVIKVEAEKNRLFYDGDKTVEYEYLIAAGGSETNFFANASLAKKCSKLDSVDDAWKIKKLLAERVAGDDRLNVVVAGGGYTGVEIAANIYRFSKKTGKTCRITIVEKSIEILSMLPGWIGVDVLEELQKRGMTVITGDTVREYDGKKVTLTSGREINNAVCVWTAGVRTPDFVMTLPGEKEKGRIKVDAALRIEGGQCDNVFVAGDLASFSASPSGAPIRMAVMFAMGEGKVAARNVVNSILGKDLVEYKAVDLGYLVPLAVNKAPGVVMGVNVKGKLGFAMHYIMCIYRLRWPNNFYFAKDLLLKKVD